MPDVVAKLSQDFEERNIHGDTKLHIRVNPDPIIHLVEKLCTLSVSSGHEPRKSDI